MAFRDFNVTITNIGTKHWNIGERRINPGVTAQIPVSNFVYGVGKDIDDSNVEKPAGTDPREILQQSILNGIAAGVLQVNVFGKSMTTRLLQAVFKGPYGFCPVIRATNDIVVPDGAQFVLFSTGGGNIQATMPDARDLEAQWCTLRNIAGPNNVIVNPANALNSIDSPVPGGTITILPGQRVQLFAETDPNTGVGIWWSAFGPLP